VQKTSRFIGARNLLSACVHWRDSDTAACHVADLVLGSFVTVKMAVSNFRRHEDTRRIRCLTLSFMMEWE
jgi:hypothetical protein